MRYLVVSFFILVFLPIINASNLLEDVHRSFYLDEYVTVSEHFASSETPVIGADQLMHAYSLYKLEKFDQSRNVLDQVEVDEPFLNNCKLYLHYLLLVESNPEQARLFYLDSDLIKDVFFQDFVFLSSAEVMLKKKDYDGFQKQFSRFKVLESIPSFRPLVLKLYFDYYSFTGDKRQASPILKELLIQHPVFADKQQLVARYNQRFQENYTLDDELKLDSERIARLEMLFKQDQYDLVIEEGERFITLMTLDSLNGIIYYWMGNAFFEKRNYFRAEEMFRRAMFYKISLDQAIESLYKQGESYFHLKDYSLAFEPWNVLVDRFPDSKWVPQVYYWLIQFFKVSGKKELYAEYMDRIKREFPNSMYYQTLLWESLWDTRSQAVIVKTDVQAKQWLQTMFGPGELMDFLFIYYKSLKNRYYFDHYSDVFVRYPIFYQTKLKLETIYENQILAKRSRDSERLIEHAYRSGFLTVYELQNKVLHDLKPEYQGFEDKQLMTNYFLGRFEQVEDTFNDLIQYEPELMSETSIRFFSPFVLGTQPTVFAKRYRVDPLLMQSIIKKASSFDPALVKKNRFGLFQLSEDSLNKINQRLGLGLLDKKRILAIDTNIKLGTFYFSWLMTQYSDIPHYALYSYLMGPEFAKKMMNAKGEQESMIDFVERTLFIDVKHFIIDVNENLVFYYLRQYLENPDQLKAQYELLRQKLTYH